MFNKILVIGIILLLTTWATSAFSQAVVSTGGKDITIDPQGQTIFIAGNEYLIRSTDGGITWSTTETPYKQPERVIVRFDDPQTVIVAKSGEIAYSSAAGAGPWTIAFQDTQTVPLRFSQSLVNPNIMFLSRSPIDSIPVILWSSDAGQTWIPHAQFSPRKYIFDIAMYPDPSDTGWKNLAFFCGQGGTGALEPWDGYWHATYSPLASYYTFMVTTVVWPPLQQNITSTAIIPRTYPISYPIRFISEDVPSGRDTIFSNDNFISADRIPKFWEADSIRMIRIRKSTNHIFVATDRGIYFSSDEGITWQQRNIGLADTNIRAIALPDSGHKVYAVTQSASFVSTNDGNSWQTIITNVADTPPSLPTGYWLSQNYPNPFNPITTFSYAVPMKSYIQITIHNILGQVVRTLVSSEHHPGSYQVTFDALGLCSGVYFGRLQSNNTTVTKRMLIIK